MESQTGEKKTITKSELIESLSQKQKHLSYRDVEFAVKSLIEQMAQSLARGERIEIRGFGSFSLHYRPPRVGRNPKTGDSVPLPGKYVPHFKPGKELRERVNESMQREAARGGENPGAAAAEQPSPGQQMYDH